MARQYSIGFETNSTTNNVEAGNIQWNQGNATASIQSSVVRTGTYAMKVVGGGGSGAYFFVPASNEFIQYTRFYFQIGSSTNQPCEIFLYGDSSEITLGGIYLNSNNTLSVYYLNTSGTPTAIASSSALTVGQWYMVDFKIDGTGGSSSTLIEARLGGSVFGSRTGAIVTGGSGGGNFVYGMDIGDTSGSTGTVYFDDIACNDDLGTTQNSYAGAGSIVRVNPSATGDANSFSLQVGGSVGSGNNYTRVQEVTPDNATSYNGSLTLNQQDLFECTDPSVGSNAVTCVQVMAVVRDLAADAVTAIRLQCERASGSTLASGTAFIPNTTSWLATTPAQSLVLYNDPTGAAWTESTLATMQIGYQLAASNVSSIDVTTIWAYVEYATAATPSSSPAGTRILLGVGM